MFFINLLFVLICVALGTFVYRIVDKIAIGIGRIIYSTKIFQKLELWVSKRTNKNYNEVYKQKYKMSSGIDTDSTNK